MSGGKIEHEVVEIRGVSSEGLKHIINYIYTSELRLNMTNIREVLAAAGHMQLKASVVNPRKISNQNGPARAGLVNFQTRVAD